MKRSFYPNIEGFRGLAVLLVLFSHWFVIAYFPSFIFLKLGFLGVNFFFVLSGFLITEILIIELYNKVNKTKIIKNFFARRVLRIFPIYYLAIIALALFNVEKSIELLPWTLTYALNIGQNWFVNPGKLFMHIWSLCVEEQFYIIWPFVLILTHKTKLFKVILAFIVFLLVFKGSIYLFGFNNYKSINHGSLFAAIDALALGGLLAYFKSYKINVWKRICDLSQLWIVFLLFSFWGISYIIEDISFISTVFMRIIAAVIAVLIIAKSISRNKFVLKGLLRTRLFMFIGKISYGVYLYHWFVSYLLLDYFNTMWSTIDFGYFGPLEIIKYHRYLGSFIFFFVITIALASLSFYLIEKPLLKLKRHFN